jgi:hypothetical protein
MVGVWKICRRHHALIVTSAPGRSVSASPTWHGAVRWCVATALAHLSAQEGLAAKRPSGQPDSDSPVSPWKSGPLSTRALLTLALAALWPSARPAPRWRRHAPLRRYRHPRAGASRRGRRSRRHLRRGSNTRPERRTQRNRRRRLPARMGDVVTACHAPCRRPLTGSWAPTASPAAPEPSEQAGRTATRSRRVAATRPTTPTSCRFQRR